MKRTAIALTLISALLVALMVGLQSVKASPKTIVVPDDYPKISEAIKNANEDDTIFVKKGTYEETVNQTLVINKTISLIGENAKATIINLHPELHTGKIIDKTFSEYANPLTIDATAVTLSGFTINSDGGVILVWGNKTQITGNIINVRLSLDGSHQTVSENIFFTWWLYCKGTYARVFKNNMTNSGILADGSYNSIFANIILGYNIHASGTCELIYSNTVKDGRGISVAGERNIVAKNTITNCTLGVGILWGGDNFVYGNNITNCNGIGLYKTESHSGNVFYANHVENNSYGAKIAYREPSLDTKLYCNNFVNNFEQVNTEKTETINPETDYSLTRPLYHSGYFDNGSVGNYWSDYTSIDANGNGIGGTPYVIDASRRDNYPLMAPFDIDSISIELPEWAIVSEVELPDFDLAEPEIFPTTLVVAASGASVAIVGVGLLVYFKKRNPKP